jgi:DNA invertase Pin-like site-specific DNA recombinase
MLIGYTRVSTNDQNADLQTDALIAAGVDLANIYADVMSGSRDDRPQLAACLKALQPGNTLVVWKLDRFGRSLKFMTATVHDLLVRKVSLKILTDFPVTDISTSTGQLMFGVFASFAQFERDLNQERTKAGLAAAKARGRVGGRPYTMTAAKLRLAQASMKARDVSIGQLCEELEISRQTLYRHVDPNGALREDGEKLLQSSGGKVRKAKPADVPPAQPGAPVPKSPTKPVPKRAMPAKKSRNSNIEVQS